MSDTDLTAGTTYHNSVSGSTPDGTYEVTNVQDATLGNDPACRKITIDTIVAPSKAEFVYAICWKDNATHTPSAQCPLTNVSFCVESKRHLDSDSGLTDSVVFVVRQNGKIYATATQSVGVNWKRASGTYTSSQFTWVNGSGSPNFTASGTVIEFGFALKLAVPKDGEPYDVVLFDNLCITRTTNCPLACSNCDFLYTGNASDISFVSEATNGTGSLLHSHAVDGAVGLPAGSHRFKYTPSPTSGWSNPPAGVFDVYEMPDVYAPSCQAVEQFVLCYNYRIETDGYNPAETGIGPAFSAAPVVIQNGKVYQYGSGPIVTGVVPTGEWKKIEFACNMSVFFEITGYFFAANSSQAYYTGRTIVGTSKPDPSQPFKLGILTRAQVASNFSTQTSYELRAWIDNLCCWAPLKCTSGSDFEADLSGASFAFPPSDISPPNCNSTVPGPGISYDNYCQCWAAIQATNSINAANSGGNLSTIGFPGTTILTPTYSQSFPGYGHFVALVANPTTSVFARITTDPTYFQGKCSASLIVQIFVRLDSGAFYSFLSGTARYTCADYHCDSSNVFTFSSKVVEYDTYSPSGCAANTGGGSRRWTLPDCDATNLFVFPGSITVSPI